MKLTRVFILFSVIVFAAAAATTMAQSDAGEGTSCTSNPTDGSGLPECLTPDDNECHPGGVLYREENQDGCASDWYWKAGWYLARFNNGQISREDFPAEFASVLPPLPPKPVEIIPMPTATPPVEEPTATPTVEEPTATPTVEEPTATPTVEEPTATPTVEEPTATPPVEEPTASPTPEEPTAAPSGKCTASYDPQTGVGVMNATWTPIPGQSSYMVAFSGSSFGMYAYGSVSESDSSFSNTHTYSTDSNVTTANAYIRDAWGNMLLTIPCNYTSAGNS